MGTGVQALSHICKMCLIINLRLIFKSRLTLGKLRASCGRCFVSPCVLSEQDHQSAPSLRRAWSQLPAANRENSGMVMTSLNCTGDIVFVSFIQACKLLTVTVSVLLRRTDNFKHIFSDSVGMLIKTAYRNSEKLLR